MGADNKIAEFLYKSGVCGYSKKPDGKKYLIKKGSDKYLSIGFFGEDVLQILTREYGIKEMKLNQTS
jgi:hypothetical protein